MYLFIHLFILYLFLFICMHWESVASEFVFELKCNAPYNKMLFDAVEKCREKNTQYIEG